MLRLFKFPKETLLSCGVLLACAAACGGEREQSRTSGDDGTGQTGADGATQDPAVTAAGFDNGAGEIATGTGGTQVVGAGGATTAPEIDPDVGDCGGMSYEADPQPVDIFIVMDASGSMFVPVVGAWYTVATAIKTFVSAPEMAGVGTALNLYNNECSVDVNAQPVVPMAALPANAAPISQTLDGYTAPLGDLTAYNTNTEPALRGAVRHQVAWQSSHPDRKASVLLVTDGFPSDECGSLDVEGAAAEGLANGVQTFVLGLGNTFGLDSVAAAGGTGVAVVADVTGQGVLDKLNEIRGRAFASCELRFDAANLPPDIDKVRLYVTNTGDGITYEVPRDRAGGAWSITQDGLVELNGTLCDDALSGLLGNLQFANGCPDQEAPPPLPEVVPQ